jgi:hypothetical protein
LVTFSGAWTDYRWSQAEEWTADYSPDHFVHLVHGVPRSHLDEAMRIARWQGAGTIFFTDRTDRTDRKNRPDPSGPAGRGDTGERGGPGGPGDAFAALPGYCDEIVSRVGPGISE